MRGLFSHRGPPIGVDVDSRHLRAAQLTPSGDGWALQAAARIPRLTPGDTLTDRDLGQLDGALERLGFRGKRLVLAVPEDKLAVDILELPPRTSSAPVDAIARTELARTHGYEPALAEMVSWDLPPSSRAKDMTQMMAVALPHADANALLDAFEKAGLEVVVLDTLMAAIVRACRPSLPEEGLSAILNLGWDAALLLLLVRGTVIYRRLMPENSLTRLADAVTRNLDLPAESVNCLIDKAAPVDQEGSAADPSIPLDSVQRLIQKPVEAIVQALQAAMAYARQMYAGMTAGRILLTGHVPAMPGIGDVLASRLGLQVRTVSPADVVQPIPGTAQAAGDPSLTATIGLALFQEGYRRAEQESHSVIPA